MLQMYIKNNCVATVAHPRLSELEQYVWKELINASPFDCVFPSGSKSFLMCNGRNNDLYYSHLGMRHLKGGVARMMR